MILCIACSAEDGIPKKYLNDCKSVLNELMCENDLVFGGSNRGIMGVAYRAAKKNQRKVIGVCPKYYKGSLSELECDQEILTEKVLESTEIMIRKCDAIILMPGGLGTLYEFFLAIQGIICKEHTKPIVIYNSCGFFDDILDYLIKIKDKKFITEETFSSFSVANNSTELKKFISAIYQ